VAAEFAPYSSGFFELSPQAQLDRLRHDELDLALLGNLGEEDRAGFQIRPLLRTRMTAVLPGDHRLAGHRQIDGQELAGDALVSLSDAVFSGRRQYLRGICRARGFDPVIAEECDSLNLVLVAVAGGAGVALWPAHRAKWPPAGSVFVRLKAPVV